ncbi:MAG: flagellar basal body-associated FliL family protein [bacterium]
MAEKEQSGADQQSKEAGSGKKGGSKMIFIILGVVVLLGAGGFFGWSHLKGGSSSAEKAPPPAPPAVVSVKPFVVNLMGTADAPRYLKLEFDLELRSGSQVKELETRMSELRDAIIVLLGSKRYEDLASIEGKDRLKEEIISRVNSRLQSATASRVFFKEFIIQ